MDKFREQIGNGAEWDLVLDAFVIEAKQNLNNGWNKTTIQVISNWNKYSGKPVIILSEVKISEQTENSIRALLTAQNIPVEFYDDLNLFKQLIGE